MADYNKKTGEVALKKWKPIIEALKVEDEEMAQLIADYAEHDIYMDQFVNTSSPNLLPAAFKVLSQLNLKNKNVILADNNYWLNKKRTELIDNMMDGKDFEVFEMSKKSIKILLSLEMLVDDSFVKTPIVKNQDFYWGNYKNGFAVQTESLIKEKLVEYINKELETKNTIYLTKLISGINIVSEDKPHLILKTLCDIV